MSDKDYSLLKNLSLVEVMRANGYEPERLPKSATSRVKYLCPLHSDHSPSFCVDQQAHDGADAPGWQCFGCGKKGYGAIALQAALMGYDHEALTDKQRHEVIQRLVDDHGVEVKGMAPTSAEQWTTPIAPQECEFDLTPWTAEHLRALGFAVKLATEAGADGEAVVKYRDIRNNGMTESRNDDAPTDGDAAGTAADHGGETAGHEQERLPLYRCSIDREYWRGRGAEKTAPEWGEILEREFVTYPCETFITGPVDAKQGGKCSLRIPARRTYPVFAMTYDWGIKKYEPKNRRGGKWYWSKSTGIATKVYGDHVAVAALRAMDNGKLKIDNDTTSSRHNDIPNGFGPGKPATEPAGQGETDLKSSGAYHSGSPLPSAPWYENVKKDRRHPLIELTKTENGEKVVYYKMKRLVLCSGPRDAMQMWAATDAHVVWLHSEQAGIRDGVVEEWLRALLYRMLEVAVNVYVCYDLDATGMAYSSSIALENAGVHLVRLPVEMSTILDGKTAEHTKPLKDVTDFVTHFSQIQKQFAPDLRKSNPSEALIGILKNALTMQFWIDKPTTKKDRDGERETNVRYVLSVANLLQFLDAKGIRSCVDDRGQRAFYQLSHNNTYRFLDTARQGNQLESVSRTAMLDWIDAHISDEDAPFKANLVNTVYTGKGLDPRTLSTMPSIPVNEHSWGEDFDHFFFANTAVRVTKDEIKAVPYPSLPYVTNEECILPGDFERIEQPWRIIVNPKYEAERKRHQEISKQCSTPAMRAAENSRWKQWVELWKYRLVTDRPLDQMPMHFRFLYNLGRIFWEKESFGHELTAVERQMQDMHFINKAHAIGYAITRHRSRASQQTVHITDYSVSDESKASGRNGKSAVIDMLATVRPSSANVAGKSMKSISFEVLMGNVVAHLHTLVCIDELPDNFSFEDLFNAGVSIVCKTLYKMPVTLRGDEVPKLFIASNKPFDRSGGSVKGRIYPCYTSNYYHAATDDGRFLDFSPKDEFEAEYGVQEVANNLPPRLLNELRNLLLGCAQFYFQHPGEVVMPPSEARSLRRELYAMTRDGALTDWLVQYFEDVPDNPHIGQPIPPQEMAISLLDSEHEAVSFESIEKAKKRISKVLKPCLSKMGIVMDPEAVLNTSTYRRQGGRRMRAWLTPLNEQGRPLEKTVRNQYRREVSTGERLPRELSHDLVFVHYFYRNRPGCVPDKPPEDGHDGDPCYVQKAAEKDPESEE